MKDSLDELVEFGHRIQEAAPKGSEDPRDWMRAASDFADACMPDGRLSPQLGAAIPIAQQGNFIRQVKAIKAASGSYNVGLRSNIDNGLALILKTLRREVAAESAGTFTISAIPKLANNLTQTQRRLFDEMWNHHLASDKPFPLRSLPRVIGKQPIEEVFRGLNGSLIYETTDEGNRCYKLTGYGAFLTGYGSVVATLLVRLLELVKEVYEQDTFIGALGSDQVKDRLKLSDHEMQVLVSLLKLGLPPQMPVRLRGWANDRRSWTLSIGDDVISLFRADDIVRYLDDILSAGYKPNEPVSYEIRRQRELEGSGAWNQSALPLTNSMIASIKTSYVSSDRMAEIRGIESSPFDCTRLMRMCEELNDCASHGNAHAVIMLTRAILDHVPPVFGFTKFADVASQYGGGGSSFKKAIERLENHSRKVADRLLHMPIRDKEVAPNMNEVSFASELETMLSELCRLLK